MIVVVTETRIFLGGGGGRLKLILRNLPFVGGSWLLWRSDIVDADVLFATKQEIHTMIWLSPSSSPWLLSAIYVSLRFVDRCLLWQNLMIVADSHNLP